MHESYSKFCNQGSSCSAESTGGGQPRAPCWCGSTRPWKVEMRGWGVGGRWWWDGCMGYPIKNFLGNIQGLRWAMSAIYSLSWESWLAYVAFIEGNFPQYIAVFGGTIPLLVRIMWALPMHYQGHFPQYT